MASDPTDASRLRLGEEAREIQEKLQLSKFRDKFALHQRFSTRPSDISQSLLDLSPQIVHFSGHGTSDGYLCFENKTGQIHPVKPASLASLFKQFAPDLKCVLLNACFSVTQAQAIAKHIDYVVGMSHAIGDKAAIAFAVGFYQALAAGRSIEKAFDLGCVQIDMENIPENSTPVIIKKKTVNGKLIIDKNLKPELVLSENNEHLECPVCGRFNKITGTFRCKICKRPNICISHLDESLLMCDGCTAEIISIIDTYYGFLEKWDFSTRKKEEMTRLDLDYVVTTNFAKKINKKTVQDIFSYFSDAGGRHFSFYRTYKESKLVRAVLRQDGSLLITVTVTMPTTIYATDKETEKEEIVFNYQYLLIQVNGIWKIEQEF